MHATDSRRISQSIPITQEENCIFQCKQECNQTLTDYFAQLNALGAEADLHNPTMDDLYMLQAMVNLKDERVMKELINKKIVHKDEFFNHALDISASYSTAKDIKDTKLVQANAATQHHKGSYTKKGQHKQQKQQSHTQQQQQGDKAKTSDKYKKCPYCGATPHPRDKCQAREATCHQCQKKATLPRSVALARTLTTMQRQITALNDSLRMCTLLIRFLHTLACASDKNVQM